MQFIRDVTAEPDPHERVQERGATFNTPKPRAGNDIWDVAGVRMRSAGPDDEVRTLSENAKRALDIAEIPHVRDEAAAKEHVDRLLRSFGEGSEPRAAMARRILATGSPQYSRAFGKALAGAPMSGEEQRALSLTVGEGGYAVPYTLDPTVIPVSNHVANPLRRISRIETIAGSNEWRGVTSEGITASYAAEGTEASDNAPTLVQPTAIVERAQAFVPFSLEIGQDWGSLQSSMAVLLADAKDVLEATKFLSGAGHSSQEPEGLLVGATGTVAGGSATYAVSNLYALEEALAPPVPAERAVRREPQVLQHDPPARHERRREPVDAAR
jgi:HK97 family phage major capsid protein